MKKFILPCNKPWNGETPYEYKTAWLRKMSYEEAKEIHGGQEEYAKHLANCQRKIRSMLGIMPYTEKGFVSEAIFRSVFSTTWVTSRTPTIRALCGLDPLPVNFLKNYLTPK